MQTIRPFYCGTQSIDWHVSNCENCKSAACHGGVCDIEIAAFETAFFGDGSVPHEVGVRMGADANQMSHGWKCLERIAVDPDEVYFKRLEPPPTKLVPLWRRLAETLTLAYRVYTPPWKRDQDDPWSCIGVLLAIELAWGLCRGHRVIDHKANALRLRDLPAGPRGA